MAASLSADTAITLALLSGPMLVGWVWAIGLTLGRLLGWEG